jgi:peptidoglycan/LPS O-acetylase OafA/YrhL
MFLGIVPENGNLYFTSNFANSHLPLHSFLFIPQAWTLGLELTFYLVAPYIVRKGFKTVITLIVMSFLLRLYIYNILCFQNDPWTYRFFPTEIMFFLLGYISYRINLKIKELSIPKSINASVLLFIIIFTITYQYLPLINIGFSPFTLNEMIYFISITFSIPILFNYLKNYKLDNKIGELSYPVYISHMLILMVCNILPFIFFKSGWVIAIITLIVSFLLNKLIAIPFESFRQARLKNNSIR